ncbi:MAG: hypothetical protein LRY71_08235 [Bacillaceae bacterium]|nr:hypothetical protein [Bacillaceae bacterium]
MPKINVPESMIALCANIAQQANCAGHRADLYLVEAAKTIAALNEKEVVSAEEVEEASEYVLPHRMREKPTEAPNKNEAKQQTASSEHEHENIEENGQNQQSSSHQLTQQQNDREQEYDEQSQQQYETEAPQEESIFDMGEAFEIKHAFFLKKIDAREMERGKEAKRVQEQNKEGL